MPPTGPYNSPYANPTGGHGGSAGRGRNDQYLEDFFKQLVLVSQLEEKSRHNLAQESLATDKQAWKEYQDRIDNALSAQKMLLQQQQMHLRELGYQDQVLRGWVADQFKVLSEQRADATAKSGVIGKQTAIDSTLYKTNVELEKSDSSDQNRVDALKTVSDSIMQWRSQLRWPNFTTIQEARKAVDDWAKVAELHPAVKRAFASLGPTGDRYALEIAYTEMNTPAGQENRNKIFNQYRDRVEGSYLRNPDNVDPYKDRLEQDRAAEGAVLGTFDRLSTEAGRIGDTRDRYAGPGGPNGQGGYGSGGGSGSTSSSSSSSSGAGYGAGYSPQIAPMGGPSQFSSGVSIGRYKGKDVVLSSPEAIGGYATFNGKTTVVPSASATAADKAILDELSNTDFIPKIKTMGEASMDLANRYREYEKRMSRSAPTPQSEGGGGAQRSPVDSRYDRQSGSGNSVSRQSYSTSSSSFSGTNSLSRGKDLSGSNTEDLAINATADEIVNNQFAYRNIKAAMTSQQGKGAFDPNNPQSKAAFVDGLVDYMVDDAMTYRKFRPEVRTKLKKSILKRMYDAGQLNRYDQPSVRQGNSPETSLPHIGIPDESAFMTPSPGQPEFSQPEVAVVDLDPYRSPEMPRFSDFSEPFA